MVPVTTSNHLTIISYDVEWIFLLDSIHFILLFAMIFTRLVYLKKTLYLTKTNDGKQLLRDLMGRFIPPEIAGAEKQGFSAPDASWFRGESIDFVKRTFLRENVAIYDVFDRQIVISLLDQHIHGNQNKRLLIWSFLSLENFMRTFL